MLAVTPISKVLVKLLTFTTLPSNSAGYVYAGSETATRQLTSRNRLLMHKQNTAFHNVTPGVKGNPWYMLHCPVAG